MSMALATYATHKYQIHSCPLMRICAIVTRWIQHVPLLNAHDAENCYTIFLVSVSNNADSKMISEKDAVCVTFSWCQAHFTTHIHASPHSISPLFNFFFHLFWIIYNFLEIMKRFYAIHIFFLFSFVRFTPNIYFNIHSFRSVPYSIAHFCHFANCYFYDFLFI